jgi:hypothetical protein
MSKKTEESMDHLLLHCDVIFSFQSLWVVLGYVSIGYRSACLLVVFGPVDECYGVGNGVHLPFLVLMEENK